MDDVLNLRHLTHELETAERDYSAAETRLLEQLAANNNNNNSSSDSQQQTLNEAIVLLRQTNWNKSQEVTNNPLPISLTHIASMCVSCVCV